MVKIFKTKTSNDVSNVAPKKIIPVTKTKIQHEELNEQRVERLKMSIKTTTTTTTTTKTSNVATKTSNVATKTSNVATKTSNVATKKRMPDIMIQLGSPYIQPNSPAMNPFIAGSPQLSGYHYGQAGGIPLKPRGYSDPNR